ncbi:MAG TPA: efflux RND transporter periplasmic adaptor subunit [Burkholderiales bacterium]|jgi:HlyD family secretion protein|nr:efflux RND transporter periplasmic adaptor subunit [Burkholderiales bacterium]
MKKKIAAGAVVLALAGYWVALLILGPKVEVVEAVRREVVQAVVATGRIESPFRVDIGAQVVGTVIRVPVAQGETVAAGQTLIELDAAEAHALVRQAEAAVIQAESRLRQLRELQLPVASQSLRQAQANYANARAQFERNRKLFDSGFIGQSVLDESQRNLDVAQTQVDTARKQVDTAGPQGSDYALAVAAREQANAGLQAARARLAYTRIVAPATGTLIARNVEHGDVVQPGKTLMVLAPTGETQIVVQIDERNIGKLRLGQPALASADAYPEKRFACEVAYINPGVDAQRGTVEVKLRVPEPPQYLRQDMTVSVDIEVARSPGALALRADAVRDATGAAPWVLRVEGARAVRRNVELGLRGTGWVEIRSGLSAGDRVVPAGAPIQPGTRLRPVPHA